MATESRFSYRTSLTWKGNRGTGTSGYTAYARDYEIAAPGKPVIPGSSDPAFRGDERRFNPEELLVAALAACHMLWYLHLCARAGVVVADYRDAAEGTMVTDAQGGGRFTSVTLKPQVTITADSDPETARSLHGPAHDKCFVANSVNFPVSCEPEISVSSGGQDAGKPAG